MNTEEVAPAADTPVTAAAETATPPAAPAAATKKPHPAAAARALLQQLATEFAVFRDCKPLAVGIDASIRERKPDIERKVLRSALRMHTASTRYLKAVERSEQRFNLDDEAAGEITAEQREHAATTLKERFAEQARQHREKRQAEASEKRRQDKLQQLVSKFGR